MDTKDKSYDSFKFQKVRAFKQKYRDNTGNQSKSKPIIFCPKHILKDFQTRFTNHPILGTRFWNPYINKYEKFPENAENLGPRHLHIMARNEYYNTNGKIDASFYGGYLSTDEIAAIRCLVKETVIAGLTEVTHRGGYGCAKVELQETELGIFIDQIGLQWQDDYRNTGGLFFYPTNPNHPDLPPGYAQWQNQVYHSVYQKNRPTPAALKHSFKVNWKGVEGVMDADGLKDSFTLEFKKALLIAQNIANTEGLKASLNFLKAGLGFFNSGLMDGKPDAHPELVIIRLEAIRAVLQDPDLSIPDILSFVLPYSREIDNTWITTDPNLKSQVDGLLDDIGNLVANRLKKHWGGAENNPVIIPLKGCVNADTGCTDNAALQGNEGEKRKKKTPGKAASVDGMKFFEYDLRNFNAGLHTEIPSCDLTSLLQGKTELEFFQCDENKPQVNPALYQCQSAILVPDSRAASFFLHQLALLDTSAIQEMNQSLTRPVLMHYLDATFKYLDSASPDKILAGIISKYKDTGASLHPEDTLNVIFGLNLIICILGQHNPLVPGEQYYQMIAAIRKACPQYVSVIDDIHQQAVKSFFDIEKSALEQKITKSDVANKTRTVIMKFLNETDLMDPDNASLVKAALENFQTCFSSDNDFVAVGEHANFLKKLEKIAVNDSGKAFLASLSLESLGIKFNSGNEALLEKVVELEKGLQQEGLTSSPNISREFIESARNILNSGDHVSIGELHPLVNLASKWLLIPGAKSSNEQKSLYIWATTNLNQNLLINNMIIATMALITDGEIKRLKSTIASALKGIPSSWNDMILSLENILSSEKVMPPQANNPLVSSSREISTAIHKIAYAMQHYLSGAGVDLEKPVPPEFLDELNDKISHLKGRVRALKKYDVVIEDLETEIKNFNKALKAFNSQAETSKTGYPEASESLLTLDNTSKELEKTEVEASEEKRLFHSMEKGDFEAARQFIRKGYDVNKTDLNREGDTPLQMAFFTAKKYKPDSMEYRNYQKIARILLNKDQSSFSELVRNPGFIDPIKVDDAIMQGDAEELVYCLKKNCKISLGVHKNYNVLVEMLCDISKNITLLSDDQYQNYQKIARILQETRNVQFGERTDLKKIFAQLLVEEPREAMLELLHPATATKTEDKKEAVPQAAVETDDLPMEMKNREPGASVDKNKTPEEINPLKKTHLFTNSMFNQTVPGQKIEPITEKTWPSETMGWGISRYLGATIACRLLHLPEEDAKAQRLPFIELTEKGMFVYFTREQQKAATDLNLDNLAKLSNGAISRQEKVNKHGTYNICLTIPYKDVAHFMTDICGYEKIYFEQLQKVTVHHHSYADLKKQYNLLKVEYAVKSDQQIIQNLTKELKANINQFKLWFGGDKITIDNQEYKVPKTIATMWTNLQRGNVYKLKKDLAVSVRGDSEFRDSYAHFEGLIKTTEDKLATELQGKLKPIEEQMAAIDDAQNTAGMKAGL